MPRKKKINASTKREIYGVFEREGIQEALKHGARRGISTRTVYRITSSEDGVFTDIIHPGSVRRWSNAQITALVRHIEENPTKTLQELVNWGTTQGFPDVSVQTISGYLDSE